MQMLLITSYTLDSVCMKLWKYIRQLQLKDDFDTFHII